MSMTIHMMIGPDFAQKAAIHNIETFFGWVSTVADFKGSFGQRPAKG